MFIRHAVVQYQNTCWKNATLKMKTLFSGKTPAPTTPVRAHLFTSYAFPPSPFRLVAMWILIYVHISPPPVAPHPAIFKPVGFAVCISLPLSLIWSCLRAELTPLPRLGQSEAEGLKHFSCPLWLVSEPCYMKVWYNKIVIFWSELALQAQLEVRWTVKSKLWSCIKKRCLHVLLSIEPCNSDYWLKSNWEK